MLTEDMIRNSLRDSASRAPVPPDDDLVRAVLSAPQGNKHRRGWWAAVGAIATATAVAATIGLAVSNHGSTPTPKPRPAATPRPAPKVGPPAKFEKLPKPDLLLLPGDSLKQSATGTASATVRPPKGMTAFPQGWSLWLACTGSRTISLTSGAGTNHGLGTVCTEGGGQFPLARTVRAGTRSLTVTVAPGRGRGGWELLLFTAGDDRTPTTGCSATHVPVPAAAVFATPEEGYADAAREDRKSPADRVPLTGDSFATSGFQKRTLSNGDVEFWRDLPRHGYELATYRRVATGWARAWHCN